MDKKALSNIRMGDNGTFCNALPIFTILEDLITIILYESSSDPFLFEQYKQFRNIIIAIKPF